MNKAVGAGMLVMLALGERLWFDLGPNVELVTTAMLLAGVYLGRGWSTAVVLLIMGVSDWVLGNSSIWLFTWSGLMMEAVGASLLLKRVKQRVWQRVGWATGAGLGASLFFYLWTNFGVWLLDSWGMYSDDIWGLWASYINGLPFLKANLLGNLVLVPLGFGALELGCWLTANVGVVFGGLRWGYDRKRS